MKHLYLLLLLPIFSIGQMNEKFRINEQQKKELLKISPDVTKNVLIVEKMLDAGSEPYISIIVQSYKNLSEKQIDKIESIVCIKCYENEWQNIVEEREITAKKEQQVKDSAYNAIFNGRIDENNKGLNYAIRIGQISDVDSTQMIADEIMTSGKRKFVLYAKYEEEYPTTEERLVFYYYPDTFTKEEMKADFEKYSNWCEQCRRVTFRIFYKGKNEDLEIPGTKTYAFKEVEGKYLDLFPWWQKRFYPDSTEQTVLEDYKLRNIGSGKLNQLIKFERYGDDSWHIFEFY